MSTPSIQPSFPASSLNPHRNHQPQNHSPPAHPHSHDIPHLPRRTGRGRATGRRVGGGRGGGERLKERRPEQRNDKIEIMLDNRDGAWWDRLTVYGPGMLTVDEPPAADPPVVEDGATIPEVNGWYVSLYKHSSSRDHVRKARIPDDQSFVVPCGIMPPLSY